MGLLSWLWCDDAQHILYAYVRVSLYAVLELRNVLEYAYFFFYSLVRGQYMVRLAARTKSGKVSNPGTAAELLLGALAGGLAQIFTIPVSVIATRQQLGSRRRHHHHHHPPTYAEKAAGTDVEPPEDESFLGVARAIVKEDGITGLWLGLRPGLVLTVNPAITYGVFERVKGIVLLARAVAGKGDGKLGPWLSFLLGATSKTLATVVSLRIYLTARILMCAPGHVPVHHGQGQNTVWCHR